MVPNEPLAIVGMACRFPGGANDPRRFWEMLCAGVDAITEVPENRWNAARFYHPTSGAPGRMVTRWGGFVDNAAAFDAAFFGIAPREAAGVDPQHRWLLETTWEAIEDAGLPPETLSGSRTGVFVGISHSDYPTLARRDASSIDRYTNIGSALSIAANRLSYLFNLRGPSYAVDTACSSSLAALHLAARSLWSGECDHAMVGGANAVLTPEGGIGFSQAHMLSPRGRCRAFDAGADGYVRSEGAAALLLMPLRIARLLGLAPRALLVATAANQDGRSTGGLTVPNQDAQETMIREALQSARLSPRDVVYMEAHGTGTPVGDPIEARALANVLSDGRTAEERLLIGSVKTNIGHLESASGMAGLIKAVLVLEQRTIPPNLHFEEPNALLPLERVSIPTTLTPLPVRNGCAPVVGVNSFGFGGSNVHALLAAAPVAEKPCVETTGEPHLFPLSARSPGALAEYAAAYAKFIDENPAVSLRELCSAAALGKSHHPLRRALVADSLAGLPTQLLAAQSTPSAGAPPKIAFVFSGQGPQWWAMGRRLFRGEKVVREIWEQCDATCRKLGGPKLLDELLADEAASRLNHTEIAQPALFTLQAGLVELWRAWGIEPGAVVGHSVGEAAAAWAAGIFDLEGIFRVILPRSRWQEKTHGQGRMLAAAISANDAKAWLQRFANRVSLAAVNAPRQVTLSGDADALEEIANALKEAEIFNRFLATEYAFHSARMDSLQEGLRRDLAGIAGADARTPMISTVTGEPARGPEMDANYWWRNVREPVHFADAVAHLLRDGCTALIEIGPHPVMAAALAEITLAEKSPAISVASLRRTEDERSTMLQALGALYERGAAVRWDALYGRPRRALRLPAYPWQRQHLWREFHGTAREFRAVPPHPLLGDRQPHPQPTWLGQLDVRTLPWLSDHRITGAAVVPAAVYLEMATTAVRELLGEPTVFFEDIKFHHLLFLPDERPVPTCVRLDPATSTFQVLTARPDAPDEWEIQADGLFRPGRLHVPPPVDLGALRLQLPEERDPRALYRDLSDIGQIYGPMFQGITSLRVRAGQAVLAEVRSPTERAWPDYTLFPPAIDSSFQSSFAIRRREDDRAVVIMSCRQLRIFQPLPETFCSHLRLVRHWKNSHAGDLTVLAPDGSVLAEFISLRLLAIEAASKPGQRDRKYYGLMWEPQPLQRWQRAAEEVLIFADRGKFAESLAALLREQGARATLVCRDGGRNGATLAVNLRQKDWATRLWKTLAARGPLPTRIVYLWNWDDDEADGCAAFLALTQARLVLPGGEDPARWLVVTCHAQAIDANEDVAPAPAAIWGFARSVQTEQPQWRLALMDCADDSCGDELLNELFAEENEPEVALRDDGRRVRRLRYIQPGNSSRAARPPAHALHLEQTGRVDSLQFRGQARAVPGRGEIEVEVAAAGLNFRDLMKALGIYPLNDDEAVHLGDEFAGRIVGVGRGVRKLRVGDRVMGLAPAGGAFGSHVISAADAVWKIPAHLDFAEAASIPVVFGTAYHALHTLARLRRGETVLIHAAAGGVGLAAVQLAQAIGATVLATAGSEEKRDYLRAHGIAHVMDSRTLDFADETLRHTGGRGVDVVLNSLAGAFQQKSLAVCAPHGRFVEIGKRDLFENNALPLAAFQRSLSFFAFDLGSVLASRGEEQRALRRFLARGNFSPIPCERFAASNAVAAFRRMQAAQHIGKIVLEFDTERLPEVSPEFWPDPEGTYLVTGGVSGFGLATAQWLADRGARHLALLSRRGVASPQNAPVIEALRVRGVSVAVIAADVAKEKSLAVALRRLKKSSPPLRGVFHSAMILRDRFIADMTQDDLAAVLAPKMTGARNLHFQTRDLPLDCFVLFSSISSVIGAPGHANYAAANAFLDALAQHRRANGLHGLSVNWGQLDNVGVAAEKAEIKRYLDGIGVQAVPAGIALATLARLIPGAEAQVGVMDVDWEKLARTSTKFTGSPVFRELAQSAKKTAPGDGSAAEWRETVRDLPSEEQAAAVLQLVLAQVSATLGTTPEDLDPNAPLASMDSLMAVELKVRIEDHSSCALPIDFLNADVTAARITERLLKQMQTATAAEPRTPAPKPPPATPAGARIDIAAPLLRIEATPLLDLVREGKLERLTAGALMPWPITLFQQTGIAPEDFFARLHGGRSHVSLDLILETPLGSVGIFMLPLTTSQVIPGEASLLPRALEGIRHASASGAQCVALTGLIPSATNYGAAVQAGCDAEPGLAPVTTGHATTVAAVLLNLVQLLHEAERALEAETVMFYGIGSIGLGALRLMLDVLPHPAELRLCDPFRSARYFRELETILRRGHGYQGIVRVVGRAGNRDADFYDASVIIGATNVENVLDVAMLAPGTLIVDDSSPHCLNGPAALARFRRDHDILFTEGGFVRSGKAMPRILHVPAAAAPDAQVKIPQLFFSMLRSEDITGCILSALLSARRPELAPTIGLIEPATARQHWDALAELDFTAAALNYEGTYLDPPSVIAFRENTGLLVAPV